MNFTINIHPKLPKISSAKLAVLISSRDSSPSIQRSLDIQFWWSKRELADYLCVQNASQMFGCTLKPSQLSGYWLNPLSAHFVALTALRAFACKQGLSTVGKFTSSSLMNESVSCSFSSKNCPTELLTRGFGALKLSSLKFAKLKHRQFKRWISTVS